MNVIELNPPEVMPLAPTVPEDFLAGPIQGAPDWQSQAVEIIRSNYHRDSQSELYVANPRRHVMDKKFDYNQQVNWEKHYLRHASRYGCIIFWLANQDLSLPYEDGRAYAQTTRIEFGRVLGWKDYDPTISLSIGIEPGYTGSEKYFRHCAKEFNLKVHEDLESLCIESLEKTIFA